MKTATMATPESRAEFERRVQVLAEQLRLGKMAFSEQVSRAADRLLDVRLLPNGRVDLLSIDESSRLLANVVYDSLLKEDDEPPI